VSSTIHGNVGIRGEMALTDAQIKAPMNVVLRSDEGAVSLLVDEICDVVNVTEQTFEAVPVTMRSAFKEIIGGVHKLDTGLMLVLDAQRAIEVGVEMPEVNFLEPAVGQGGPN
jgi:purine-binding chemotaxis protein CheW